MDADRIGSLGVAGLTPAEPPPHQRGRTIPTAGEMLTTRIHRRARAAGVALDVYDPDFIVGVVMEFLAEHEAVLTPAGIVKEAVYFGSSQDPTDDR